jgi:hypothetical protein
MSDSVPVWPVVLGAGIALLGSWGSQIIQWQWDRKKRRSDKFQELVSAIYETDHWLERQRNYRVFGAPEPTDPSPLAKARTIAAVYFIRQSNDIETYADAVRKYELWQLDMAKNRLANLSAFVAVGGKETYADYFLALDALLKKLTDYARREFQ